MAGNPNTDPFGSGDPATNTWQPQGPTGDPAAGPPPNQQAALSIAGQNPQPAFQRAPIGSAWGHMTKEEWRNAILEDLGGEGVDVELSEQQLDFCIKRALALWAKHRPLKMWFPFSIAASETVCISFFNQEALRDNRVAPETWVRGVRDVIFSDQDRRTLGARSGFLSGYYLRWGYQGPRLFYELHTAERTYERLTGSRPGWYWEAGSRNLFISAPSRDVRALVLAIRPRLIEEIPPDHEDDFLQAAVARAKRIAARVLGSRGPIPGAAGEIRTDAAELRREAKEEWDEVRARLAASLAGTPTPRYIG